MRRGKSLILYYPKFEFDILVLVPVLFFCICLYNFITMDKSIILIFKTILWGIACFVVLACVFIIEIAPIMCFNSGDYITVEGYVEDYTPYSQGEMESFSINGVEFSYSHGIIASGYRKTYNRGGVVRENGQYLRIAYLPMEHRNAILCIQEPPFVDEPEKEVSIFVQFYIITIPLILFVFYFTRIKYRSRKRIVIDQSKSFIKQVTEVDGYIKIKYVIAFNNKFEEEKRIKLYGDFKKLMKNNIITVRRIEGRDETSTADYLSIPAGNSKIDVSFISQIYKKEKDIGADDLGVMLPKIKVKILN